MTLTHTLLAGARAFSEYGHNTLLIAFAGMAAAFTPRSLNPEEREGFSELKKMSEADLRDIGLTRGDIEWAHGLPTGSQVTEALDRLRQDRHHW